MTQSQSGMWAIPVVAGSFLYFEFDLTEFVEAWFFFLLLGIFLPSPTSPLPYPLFFPTESVMRGPAKSQNHPIYSLIFIGNFSSFPPRSTNLLQVQVLPELPDTSHELRQRNGNFKTHTLSRWMQIKPTFPTWKVETRNTDHKSHGMLEAQKAIECESWNSVQTSTYSVEHYRNRVDF